MFTYTAARAPSPSRGNGGPCPSLNGARMHAPKMNLLEMYGRDLPNLYLPFSFVSGSGSKMIDTLVLRSGMRSVYGWNSRPTCCGSLLGLLIGKSSSAIGLL